MSKPSGDVLLSCVVGYIYLPHSPVSSKLLLKYGEDPTTIYFSGMFFLYILYTTMWIRPANMDSSLLKSDNGRLIILSKENSLTRKKKKIKFFKFICLSHAERMVGDETRNVLEWENIYNVSISLGIYISPYWLIFRHYVHYSFMLFTGHHCITRLTHTSPKIRCRVKRFSYCRTDWAGVKGQYLFFKAYFRGGLVYLQIQLKDQD